MRRLLMSAAALAFLTVPVLAQPDHDRGHRGERAHDTAQNREQAAPRQAAPQQQSTPFNRSHNPGSEQHVSPVVQPQAAAPLSVPQNRGDRGRNAWQGQGGDRRAIQQAAPFTQPQATTQNRSDRGRNDWQGGRSNNNFGNRPGGASADRGALRDYSSFRDYHRTFNAPSRFRAPDYRRPNGWYDHRWSFGEFLPSLFWGNSYWLTDYYRYGLPPPPYGTVWVRERHDALLIDRDTGEIISVAYDVFY